MPILNYTTKVNYLQSISEIQRILVKHGAKKITTDYDSDIPVAVTFSFEYKNKIIAFSLPVNYEGVFKAMERNKDVPRHLKTMDRAMNVGWRIVKDWIESQMAIVEAGLVELPEAFLPYAIVNDGRKLFEYLMDDNKNTLLLSA